MYSEEIYRNDPHVRKHAEWLKMAFDEIMSSLHIHNYEEDNMTKKKIGLVRSVGLAPNLPESQKTLERVVKKAKAEGKSDEEVTQLILDTRRWLRGQGEVE
jgi:hypothetical protein